VVECEIRASIFECLSRWDATLVGFESVFYLLQLPKTTSKFGLSFSQAKVFGLIGQLNSYFIFALSNFVMAFLRFNGLNSFPFYLNLTRFPV
jgi:hypothetical protein